MACSRISKPAIGVPPPGGSTCEPAHPACEHLDCSGLEALPLFFRKAHSMHIHSHAGNADDGRSSNDHVPRPERVAGAAMSARKPASGKAPEMSPVDIEQNRAVGQNSTTEASRLGREANKRQGYPGCPDIGANASQYTQAGEPVPPADSDDGTGARGRSGSRSCNAPPESDRPRPHLHRGARVPRLAMALLSSDERIKAAMERHGLAKGQSLHEIDAASAAAPFRALAQTPNWLTL